MTPGSHGLVSFAVQCSFAPTGPLSDPGSHGSVSFALRSSLARGGPLSGQESLTLIALSSGPRSSPARQQTAKHDGLYPLLSVSLTMSPFVERFQQRDDPCHVGFYASSFLFLLRIP